MVETLGGFLDAVGVERVHLVGHSMGGAVALAYAIEHPERVASLTLIDSAGLGEEINDEYIQGFVGAGRRREMKQVLQLLFADPGLVHRQLVDDVLRYKRPDGVQDALQTIARAMFPDGRQAAVLIGKLSKLSVPLLTIWGGEDQDVPPAQAEPPRGHGRVEVLAGSGHSPHMEAANQVNHLVQSFLNQAEREAT